MNGTVAVGYLDSGVWSAAFGQSLIRMYIADSFGKQRIMRGRELRNLCHAGGLVDGRNKVAASFLDDTECEWLLWLDSDMSFDADLADRLVDAADPETRPVVGALCFALRRKDRDERFAEHNAIVPTMYNFVETDEVVGWASILHYEPDALMRVAGTGSAAILIHRRALTTVRERAGDHWYDPVEHPKGARFSEDLSFCVRLAAAGLPIHVHTGIQTAHDKGGIFLDETTYLAQPDLPRAS